MTRRPIDVGGNEGRDWPESHAATVACYLGLWNLICAPFRWMRSLNVGDWLAIVMLALVVCSVVWGGKS